MFGIGSTELLLILVVALIVLGPKSLAGFSRILGKTIGEIRRVSTDFQRTLNLEAAEEELREAEKQRQQGSKNKSASESESANVSAIENPVNLPEDSPLAQALERAKSQAEHNPENSSNSTAGKQG